VRRFALLPFVLALSASGCVPGVGWLPDSSGFIYTAGARGQKLVHYDLAQGRRQVLVEDTGAETNWPAVRPDGRQIAVAKLILKKGEKKSNLQVILYSRAGKLLKRSKVFDWLEGERAAKSDREFDRTAWPQLFWGPAGDRIIVHTGGYTGIYDVKTDRLIHAGMGMLLSFGGTPIRPDGKGFLIIKNWRRWMQFNDRKNATAPDPEFTFVDWQGKEQPLKPPALLQDRAALKKEKDENKLAALLCPVLYDSRWEGDVAQVSWKEDRLRYLTGKGEAVLDRIKPATTADGQIVLRRYQFPESETRLRIVATKAKNNAARPGLLRVEVRKAGQKEYQVVLDQTKSCVLLPAPNRKLVAVRTFASANQTKGEMILVINARGEVVARFPVES
jgi:hypothetical protein